MKILSEQYNLIYVKLIPHEQFQINKRKSREVIIKMVYFSCTKPKNTSLNRRTLSKFTASRLPYIVTSYFLI